MNDTRRFPFLAVAAMIAVALPCNAQDQNNGQATPDVTGTGKTNHIPIWRSTTALGSSGIVSIGGNVGVGTDTPVTKLEVNGSAQVDGNFSLSGSILLNGVGQLLWAPNDNSKNFSAGVESLQSSTTGTYNTALGFGSLWSNTDGGANTAIGAYALTLNVNGGDNVAVGSNALAANTSGGGNTAVGTVALLNDTTGSFNTATGYSALAGNTTGSNNIAVGYAALQQNTTGMENVAIGVGALDSANADMNVAIGYLSGRSVTTGVSNIFIANQGTSTDSQTIRLGCTVGCLAAPQTATFIAGIYGSSTGLANVGVVVDANGNLGTIQSSRRYKEDINDMADASDGLMQLRPVTFRYKKAYEDGSKPVQYGLIAEEVADVYPDLVARSADGQVESVRYQLLDPMLLNELQKQHATIDAQKEQIRSLEERLARIEAMLTAGASGAAGK